MQTNVSLKPPVFTGSSDDSSTAINNFFLFLTARRHIIGLASKKGFSDESIYPV